MWKQLDKLEFMPYIMLEEAIIEGTALVYVVWRVLLKNLKADQLGCYQTSPVDIVEFNTQRRVSPNNSSWGRLFTVTWTYGPAPPIKRVTLDLQ